MQKCTIYTKPNTKYKSFYNYEITNEHAHYINTQFEFYIFIGKS